MVKAAIREISNSQTLRWFGLCLVLIHLWTFLFWNTSLLGIAQDLQKILHDHSVVCWPTLPQCQEWRHSFLKGLPVLLTFYASLIALGLFAFLFNKIRLAYLTLWALTITKLAFVAQDYRFVGDYHYMPLFLTAVYLLLPNKVQTIKILIVLFYFAAGLLKFNWDWLSGVATPGLMPPGPLLQAAAFYAIVLELAVTWLLFSRRPLLFWLAFAQLAAFHLLSYRTVGGFYPICMFTLLPIFIMDRAWPTPIRPVHWATIAVVGFFICLQIPRHLFPRADVTGKGRLFALNMMDSFPTCDNVLMRRGDATELSTLIIPYIQFRIHCDPIVYLALLKEQCRERSSVSTDFDFLLFAGRYTDRERIITMNVHNVCANPPQIDLLGQITQ